MAEKKLLQLPAPGLGLAATLLCGQSFSWREEENGVFTGAAAQHAARVWMQGDTLFVQPLNRAGTDGETAAFWRHYFALEEDYAALHARFAKNRRLAECVALSPGMRVLRQPFWDTLLSFIISQNNNLGRITGIVTRLREGFGEALGGGEHAFPTPRRLAGCTLEELAPLRAGFRAKYLLDAARRVAAGEITGEGLAQLCDDEAREALCAIHGVGVKVADCVLLYGLGRRRVVPMDVWMKRAMAKAFPRGMPAPARGHEGIAQQYIFVWARENL